MSSYKVHSTVESSLFMWDQSSWLLCGAHTHKYTSPWTLYFCANFSNNPRSHHIKTTVWYSIYPTVVIMNDSINNIESSFDLWSNLAASMMLGLFNGVFFSLWWQYECDCHYNHRCPRMCHHMYLCRRHIPCVVRQTALGCRTTERPRLPQPNTAHLPIWVR